MREDYKDWSYQHEEKGLNRILDSFKRVITNTWRTLTRPYKPQDIPQDECEGFGRGFSRSLDILNRPYTFFRDLLVR